MSDDLRWTPVGRTGEWREAQGRVVQVGARRIAVFRTGEDFHALKDACPHAGASLGGGRVGDGTVACPAHAWTFQLGDGRCTGGPAGARAIAYPVRVVDGTVEVGIP